MCRRWHQLIRASAYPSPPSSNRKLFLFGLGYTSLGLANKLLQSNEGWQIGGSCRDPDKREALALRGIRAFDFDPDNERGLDEEGLDFLLSCTHVLSSVPPVGDFDKDPVLQQHALDLVRIPRPPLQWVGYLSSTSVYGDHGGQWVDETSKCYADDGKGKHRIDAELDWLRLYREYLLPVHVFRLGGIYGPRRNALETARRKQQEGGPEGATQRRRAQQRYTSRVHVADIVSALRASMRHPTPGETYNVADDDPAPRGEVNEYVASLLAGPNSNAITSSTQARATPSGDPNPRDCPGSSGLPEKRVSNQKMKERLGVALAYPTYREGLRAIHEGNMDPFSYM